MNQLLENLGQYPVWNAWSVLGRAYTSKRRVPHVPGPLQISYVKERPSRPRSHSSRRTEASDRTVFTDNSEEREEPMSWDANSDNQDPAELVRRVRRLEDEISDLRERIRRIERNIDSSPPGSRSTPLPGTEPPFPAFQDPTPSRHGPSHPTVVTPGSAVPYTGAFKNPGESPMAGLDGKVYESERARRERQERLNQSEESSKSED
jgi:hypothetical protein